MSYLNKYIGASPSVAGPVSLTSAADVMVFPLPYQLKIGRIMALVTTAVVSTGAVVLTVVARPTHGSTSGEVTLGTLTIPAAAVVGATYYKDLSDALAAVQAGQEVVFKVSTAAAGGGAAGAVNPMFVGEEAPDVALNQVNLVASA